MPVLKKDWMMAWMRTIGLGLLVVCSGCNRRGGDPNSLPSPNADNGPSNTDLVVNADKRYQTMEGFGATHLPLVYEGIGDVLSPGLRAKAIDAVYNQVGIGMGNLEGALLESPAGWDERGNDNNDPFIFNGNGFQKGTAHAIKEGVVDLARPFGFDHYYIAQKINVRWASPWLNNIRKTDYRRYLDESAEQIAAGQIHWREAYGIVPRYQMPFNEPLSGNTELLNGTVRDVVDIIKRAGSRLRAEGFGDIKFVIPNEETEEKSLSTAAAILSDPEARQYVGAIGYHPYPYGSVYASIPKILGTAGAGRPDPGRIAVRNKLRDLGGQYGIPVWMTEVSHGAVDPRSLDDFRGRAIHIHDELVYADAAAYFGMNNMWDRVSQRQHFGNSDLFSGEGTVVLIDNDTETVYITGMGHAIGHYARWIKRGAVRVEATSTDRLVLLTAFRDDRLGRVTMVILNNAAGERTLNVNVSGLRLSGNLAGEQSTAAGYRQPVKPLAPTPAAGFKLTVPALSVTTLAGTFEQAE